MYPVLQRGWIVVLKQHSGLACLEPKILTGGYLDPIFQADAVLFEPHDQPIAAVQQESQQPQSQHPAAREPCVPDPPRLTIRDIN